MEWNEHAEKVVRNFGVELLNVLDNCRSLAQAFDFEKVCRCDSCIERNGEELICAQEKEREETILSMREEEGNRVPL